ncbi:hypothetical protein K456DRAFT_1594617 [Colletotrichum gloeosporioides 23]|nr:hypothetical protein K456DRAFT_1594617 [Colletotrichum gloeosporioides 23]
MTAQFGTSLGGSGKVWMAWEFVYGVVLVPCLRPLAAHDDGRSRPGDCAGPDLPRRSGHSQSHAEFVIGPNFCSRNPFAETAVRARGASMNLFQDLGPRSKRSSQKVNSTRVSRVSRPAQPPATSTTSGLGMGILLSLHHRRA